MGGDFNSECIRDDKSKQIKAIADENGRWIGKRCSQYIADTAEINRCVLLSISRRAEFYQNFACA